MSGKYTLNPQSHMRNKGLFLYRPIKDVPGGMSDF